jgi:hypothetical protein
LWRLATIVEAGAGELARDLVEHMLEDAAAQRPLQR